MIYFETIRTAIAVAQGNSKRLVGSKIREAVNVNAVIFQYLVVIGRVTNGDAPHALLFEVSFVDTGTGLDQDNAHTQVTGLHRCACTRTTFHQLFIPPTTIN